MADFGEFVRYLLKVIVLTLTEFSIFCIANLSISIKTSTAVNSPLERKRLNRHKVSLGIYFFIMWLYFFANIENNFPLVKKIISDIF